MRLLLLPLLLLVTPVGALAQTPPLPAPPNVAAAPANATRTASGLAYIVLRPGTGTRHPSATSTVSAHYTGWTSDGHMFDSSVVRGQPFEASLSHVIRGWTEGLQLMTEGERARFWIPAALAYGVTPRPGVPQGMLVFDIELIHIVPPPTPMTQSLSTTAPTDVAAPPANAQHTPSGLAYRSLRPGTGTRHPGPTTNVEVHYSGWTTDGHLFDSSITRGQPAQFPLNRVIPGWTEGLQLMTEGQQMRFWIPGALAYDQPGRPARPGVPHGMLVFDVELIRIVN